MTMSKSNKKPKVYLVGAGPGAADLITLRGAELIKNADCIIADKLVNPALLAMASPKAEIINVPKRIGPGSFKQYQVNKLIIKKAAQHKTIVRLKGGDPTIFARTAEETALLAENNIDFEIVPGVTAALAAAATSGIILTDRDKSSQVLFITGTEADNKQQSNIDFSLLAKFPGTIVFYMAVGNLRTITKSLMDNQMPPDTPAALIENAATPTQRIVRSNLNSIVSEKNKHNIKPPALFIIGKVVDSETKLNWYTRKPLLGKTILITRDSLGNAQLAAKLEKTAAIPLCLDTYSIEPLTHTPNFQNALKNLGNYHWLVFTSANGVRLTFDALESAGKDARAFANNKIACIGTETAGALQTYTINPDLIPEFFTSQDLAKQLILADDLTGKKILLLRSALAEEHMKNILTSAGAIVDKADVYTLVETEQDTIQAANNFSNSVSFPYAAELITNGRINWIIFASPTAAKLFFKNIPPNIVKNSTARIASIGPVTTKHISEFGIKPDIEPANHTIDDLLDVLERIHD